MRVQKLSSIWRNNRGVALIEFAIVFPVLMLLVLLGLEFTRYFLIHLKVEKTAVAMANIITQYPPATNTPANAGELSQHEMFVTLGNDGAGHSQLQKMLYPYNNNDDKATMIVTSVRKEVNQYSKRGVVVKWQICTKGLSGCSEANSIVTQTGVPGGASFVKNVPASFSPLYTSMLGTMADGENMIVTEVHYDYQPLYTNLFLGLGNVFKSYKFPGLAPSTVSHVVFTVPRSGSMACLPPASGDTSTNTYFSYNDPGEGCPCTNNAYDSGCGSLPL